MNSLPIAVMSTIFFVWFGEVRSTKNTIEGDHSKSFASAACKPRQPPRWFLEEDDGEAESAKSEMMVASSMLCYLTPHCFVISDRRDSGVDSVLYTVHASKHGRKRRDIAFFYSFNQSIRDLRFHPFGFWQHCQQWFPRCQKLFSHLATHCGCP